MAVLLVKMSAPDWEKEFPDTQSAVIELRKHICKDCLRGGDEDPALDIVVDGLLVECHDADSLLETRCGYEFHIEETEEG